MPAHEAAKAGASLFGAITSSIRSLLRSSCELGRLIGEVVHRIGEMPRACDSLGKSPVPPDAREVLGTGERDLCHRRRLHRQRAVKVLGLGASATSSLAELRASICTSSVSECRKL